MWLVLDPLLMSLVGLLAIESMAFFVLWLPFGILTVAQLVRAASSPGKEGLPRMAHSETNVKRWHVAAVCLVASTAIISGIRYSVSSDNAVGDLVSAFDSGQYIEFALWEMMVWLVVGASIFGFFYLGRLQRSGKPHVEFCWLGLCVLPAAVLMLPLVGSDEGFASVAVVGFAGIAAYVVAVLLPRGVPKPAVWAISCCAIAVSLSDVFGPGNPVWLFGTIAAGYAVYRMEWKDSLRADAATPSIANSADSGIYPSLDSTHRDEPTATIRRTVGVLTIVTVSVLALVLLSSNGPVIDGSLPAEYVALVSLTIAAIGAAMTAIASAAMQVRGSRIDDAAAVFVVLLAVASVIHLIGAPEVKGVMFGTAASSQYWKLVLGFFACLGAVVIAFTTLTGKARQVRPFMVATVIPAAFLLPSAAFFTFEPDSDAMAWLQRAIEAGVTLTMMSLMWHVFGPGRRMRQTQAVRAQNEAAVEAAAA